MSKHTGGSEYIISPKDVRIPTINPSVTSNAKIIKHRFITK